MIAYASFLKSAQRRADLESCEAQIALEIVDMNDRWIVADTLLTVGRTIEVFAKDNVDNWQRIIAASCRGEGDSANGDQRQGNFCQIGTQTTGRRRVTHIGKTVALTVR